MSVLAQPAFCSPFLDGCGARRTTLLGETRAGRLRTDSVSGLHARIVREGRTNVPVSQAGRGDAATRADLNALRRRSLLKRGAPSGGWTAGGDLMVIGGGHSAGARLEGARPAIHPQKKGAVIR